MNTIPLHQLPDEAFSHVLRSMEVHEQLAYSLCSKNAKKAIKSLNLRATFISMKFSANIAVEISFGNSQYIRFTLNDDHFPNNQIIACEDMKVHVGRSIRNQEQRSWNLKNFEFKKWIHHFFEVLHYPRIDDLAFSRRSIDDNFIEHVKKIIEGLQIRSLSLCPDLTNDFVKKALESFPNYEELFLGRIPFGRTKLNKVLAQNTKLLCIAEAEGLEIDQMLLTNSEKIKLFSSTFTEKDFNRFLKLWIGGSNPRLKNFFTWIQLGNNSLDKSVILKGIQHNVIPLDSKEVYRDYVTDNYYCNETKLAGGSRIQRFDGTTAVIVVDEQENRFEFIVE
ncbi:unnamed protein product [Caenorhabditis brenneri]